VSSGVVSHPAVLIPWPEVKHRKETRFFLQPAAELTIGEPKVATVTLLGDLAAAVRPFLPPGG